MRFGVLIFIIISLPGVILGQARSFQSGGSSSKGQPSGLIFDGGLGYTEVTLKNPSGSEANYRGPSLQGRLGFALIGNPLDTSWNLHGVIRYTDLSNRNNNDNQTETANLLGSGIGTTLGLNGIFIGAEYILMLARHYAVGAIDNRLNYSFYLLNTTAGVRRNIGQGLQFIIAGSYGMGTISASQIGSSQNAKYTDTTIWLQVVMNTEINPLNFFTSKSSR